MKIDPATPDDLDEVAALWHRSWLSADPPDPAEVTASTLRSRLQRENWELHVVRDDGQVVAFLAVDDEAGTLSQMFVEPAWQRQGIGRFLLEHAKQRMPDGFGLRTDETNAEARRFYDYNGLVLEGCKERRAYYRWQPGR